MDWKTEAIDKLKQYEAKKLSLRNIPEEISRLESAIQSIRSAGTDGIRVKGGGQREDLYLSNIVRRAELERSLEQTRKWVALVEEGLNALNEEERLILDRLYINPGKGNVDRLCMELGCEQATVYRRREQAIRKFTLSLYGCMES